VVLTYDGSQCSISSVSRLLGTVEYRMSLLPHRFLPLAVSPSASGVSFSFLNYVSVPAMFRTLRIYERPAPKCRLLNCMYDQDSGAGFILKDPPTTHMHVLDVRNAYHIAAACVSPQTCSKPPSLPCTYSPTAARPMENGIRWCDIGSLLGYDPRLALIVPNQGSLIVYCSSPCFTCV